MQASLDDVLALARELLAPRLVAAETHAEMVAVQFPGLDGVLPEFGRFSPLDWGLGVELKGDKAGHWSGTRTSPRDVRPLRREPARSSGSIRSAGVACAGLTTRRFGDWAKDAWPRLSDAVLAELG